MGVCGGYPAHAVHCPPRAGEGAVVNGDVDGDKVNDWSFPALTQRDKSGNKIELFCLKGRGMFGSRYTDAATGNSYWIGACVFPGGQNKRSKEKYKEGPKKGDWKMIDWFNYEPPPDGNDDWHFVYDPNTGELTITKTSGEYWLVLHDGTWYRQYRYTEDGNETNEAPEDFNDLKYDGNSILLACADCGGLSEGNIHVDSNSPYPGGWTFAFTTPSFGGTGTEEDPIVGTVAEISPGDTLTIRGEGITSASVDGDAAGPSYGGWTVAGISAGEVTFAATADANIMPGQTVGDFNVSSNYVGYGAVAWDSTGRDICYAGCVEGPGPSCEMAEGPKAGYPNPWDGDSDVAPGVILSWTPGEYAGSHDVYLGTDFDDVNDANTNSSEYKGQQDPCEWVPGVLELDTTYHWRIDEVNEAHPNSPWKGDLWSFTTANYLVVDDMESYDTLMNQIYYTWEDGSLNWTGSWLELGTVPTHPVHGGGQSMVYYYDNSGLFMTEYYSEIEADPAYLKAGSDWTILGVKALTLYFYGDPDNDANDTEQMYVGLEDSRGAVSYAQLDYDGDMNDIRIAEWQEWNIALEDFSQAGVDLNDVATVYIGFGIRGNPYPSGTPGGEGVVYFDDIRLYPPRCIPEYRPVADLTGDCVVDHKDLRIIARDWLDSDKLFDVVEPNSAHLAGWWELDEGAHETAYDSSPHGNNGTATGSYAWVAGRVGPHAMEFSGGKVLVADAPELRPPAEVSVSAWVKYSQAQNYHARVVVKGADNSETYALLINEIDELVFHIRDVNGAMHAVAGGLWNDEWIHVAGTYDGNSVKCYIDGELEDSTPAVAIPLSQDTSGLAIGNRSDGNDRGFKGAADDVRVYDYGLTAAEVAYLATEGTGYVPLLSPANIYDEEPMGSRIVNLNDYAIVADMWLVTEGFFPCDNRCHYKLVLVAPVGGATFEDCTRTTGEICEDTTQDKCANRDQCDGIFTTVEQLEGEKACCYTWHLRGCYESDEPACPAKGDCPFQ
jgi:hypothetical protein